MFTTTLQHWKQVSWLLTNALVQVNDHKTYLHNKQKYTYQNDVHFLKYFQPCYIFTKTNHGESNHGNIVNAELKHCRIILLYVSSHQRHGRERWHRKKKRNIKHTLTTQISCLGIVWHQAKNLYCDTQVRGCSCRFYRSFVCGWDGVDLNIIRHGWGHL